MEASLRLRTCVKSHFELNHACRNRVFSSKLGFFLAQFSSVRSRRVTIRTFQTGSNPQCKRWSKSGVKSLERTIAHKRRVCRARLQPAPGVASSANSERIERVRYNRYNVAENVCQKFDANEEISQRQRHVSTQASQLRQNLGCDCRNCYLEVPPGKFPNGVVILISKITVTA